MYPSTSCTHAVCMHVFLFCCAVASVRHSSTNNTSQVGRFSTPMANQCSKWYLHFSNPNHSFELHSNFLSASFYQHFSSKLFWQSMETISGVKALCLCSSIKIHKSTLLQHGMHVALVTNWGSALWSETSVKRNTSCVDFFAITCTNNHHPTNIYWQAREISM